MRMRSLYGAGKPRAAHDQAGAAIFAILTFIRAVEDLFTPWSASYSSRYWDGPTTPLYPFGYGLSYTTFSIANLKVAVPQVKAGSSVAVTADVTNTGSVVGDEVVQLYIHQKAGSDSRPMRELKGFERLTLKPGETKTVTFALGPAELSYWSTKAGKRSRTRRPSTCGWAPTRRRRSTRTWRWYVESGEHDA